MLMILAWGAMGAIVGHLGIRVVIALYEFFTPSTPDTPVPVADNTPKTESEKLELRARSTVADAQLKKMEQLNILLRKDT